MIQSIGYQTELGTIPKKDRERIVSIMTEVIKDLKTTLNQFVPISKDIISKLRASNTKCLNILPETQRTRRLVRGVPSDFKSALLTDQSGGKSRYKGRMSVYAASPIELVQRVSSVARAANALEFAAAMAATLPAKGVGAEGTLGYTRSATGKVDAMERVPLVVGFSESNNSDAGNTQTPAFGWLLGPKVKLNPENQTLELEHRIAPYSLTADVSIPSWWPYLKITSQSAWAPNWQKETILDETQVNKKAIPVPMRHNSADLDNITDLMVARFSGQLMEIAEIERIEPNIVSRCAGKITFLISGMNLWRSSEVYLMGQKGTNVKVLPNMAGISVNFDIGTLPQPSSADTNKETTLTVWTRNGVATANVLITGKKSNANGCVENSPTKPDTDNGKLSLTTVLPNEISVCDTSPHFIVEGKNLKTIQSVYLGTLKADTHTEVDPKNGTLLEIKFNKRIAEKAKKISKLPLIIRTPAGAASLDVKITDAECK